MDRKLIAEPGSRPRRRHSAEFKAQIIEACMQPGVSIAAVALANQLNANFVRSWVKAYRDEQSGGVLAGNIRSDSGNDADKQVAPTLVPVTVHSTEVQSSSDIQIEIRRQQTAFKIAWPASQAMACAQLLRELLR
jgi:transposase